MNVLYWLGRSFFKIYFKLFFRHKSYFATALPPGGAILAANHASFFDPPLVGCSVREGVHFLARDSLFRVPVFGRLITCTHAHPISRQGGDLKSMKTICRLLQEGKKVVIFPEGTRTEDGRLAPIKQGVALIAMRTNVPIVPVFISGSFEAWGRHRKFPRLFGSIACIFGTPIAMDGYRDMPKEEAYAAISGQLTRSLEALSRWYDSGHLGTPP